MLEIPPAIAQPEIARFSVRPMRDDDRAFVYSSFLRAYRESDATEGIPNERYYAVFTAQLDAALKTFEVLVAHPEGDDSEIAGWLAHHALSRTVCWIYVKRDPWRQLGVARLLLTEAGYRPGGLPIGALFGSRWALRLAREKGYETRPVSYLAGLRLLGGF